MTPGATDSIQQIDARRDGEVSFVLVEATSGNCGDMVRVFDHCISYDSPRVGDEAFQDHTFEETFSRGCVTSVYVGDIDNDGWGELVVEVMVDPGRFRAEAKYGYRALRRKDGLFRVIGEMDTAEVKKHPALTRLSIQSVSPSLSTVPLTSSLKSFILSSASVTTIKSSTAPVDASSFSVAESS